MKTIWEQSYIVTDVETTGHSPFEHRITEIACVVIEGGEIVREYSTLINPHQLIPPYIANMTGISNGMAKKAPEESSIRSIIHELLSRKSAVFSAHNIEFDWSFVKQLLQRGDIQAPAIPMLCSLKLARRILPNDIKKNVGALAQYFNISISNRHRALGDARATAQILIELIEIAEKEYGIKYFHELVNFQNTKSQNFNIKSENQQKLKTLSSSLPTSSGVYKFFNEGGEIIYIGKSKNLRARVSSYFSPKGTKSKKVFEISSMTSRIEIEETDSELEALLLEAELIKKHKPHFNKAIKNNSRYPFIKITTNEDFPKSLLTHDLKDDGATYFGPFSNSSVAEDIHKIINNNFKLIKCDFDNRTNTAKKPCIYMELGKCALPCNDSGEKENYKNEVQKVEFFLGGISSEIIERLEQTMQKLADENKFELATKIRDQLFGLKKLFDKFKHAPISISNNNLILISPESKREQTLDIYIIKKGDFSRHFTIGKFAGINKIKDEITKVFSEDKAKVNSLKNGEYQLKLERLKIVNSWLYRQKEKCKIIYSDNKNIKEFLLEIENAIRNFKFI
jgi:DNA polymerase III subunit epsilon